MAPLRLALACLGLTLATTACAGVAPPPRRTLGRVFEKLKAEKDVTVAYFGGSITQGEGYRTRTFRWFQDTFPRARLVQVNAAIGGTGSDLGAFRCGPDVIAH